MMIAVAILFYGVTGYLTYQNFDWYYNDNPDDCHKEKNLIIVSIVFMALCTVLFPLGAQPSLLTTGIICFLIWTFTFQGLSMGSNAKCNELLDSNKTYAVKLIWGLFGFILVVVGDGMNLAKFNGMSGNLDENGQEQAGQPEDSEIVPDADPQENNADSYWNFQWLTFHGIMFLGGTAYLVMIISNWGAVDYASFTFADHNQNEIAVWVQCVLGWITGSIYIWSIFASRFYGQLAEEEAAQGGNADTNIYNI